MRRSGFRKQSLEEVREKQAKKRKTALTKQKTNKTLRTANRGTRKPVKKSKSLAKLKKELDRVFSIYIRAKYPKECYTCRKVDITLQCGHFVSRQYLATRWSEMNCRPQCVGCNIYGDGKFLDFEQRLKEDFGEKVIEELKQSRHISLKLDRQWYEAEIAKYKALI